MGTLTDVVVYGTLEEARRDGASRRGLIWVTADGSRVVTPGSLRAVDGLRVTSYTATHAAKWHPAWPQLEQLLKRSMLKTRPS